MEIFILCAALARKFLLCPFVYACVRTVMFLNLLGVSQFAFQGNMRVCRQQSILAFIRLVRTRPFRPPCCNFVFGCFRLLLRFPLLNTPTCIYFHRSSTPPHISYFAIWTGSVSLKNQFIISRSKTFLKRENTDKRFTTTLRFVVVLL